MRLEKGHFIVGQDTDGLTKAPAVGLSHLIKLDKHDFAGKPELSWAMDDTAPVLVAIQPTDPGVVPDEAAQIVRLGTDEIIGRITSSRMSPTLERSVCLGQVLPEASDPGTELTVVMIGRGRITARVMEQFFTENYRTTRFFGRFVPWVFREGARVGGPPRSDGRAPKPQSSQGGK